MYNVTSVTTALRGLIGFRAHNDEGLPDLEEALTLSRSGLWLDKAHPLLTAQNLYGAAVVLTPNETADPLSTLIGTTLDDSVASVLAAVRTRKLLRLESTLLLNATPLYEGEGSISELITPANRFVGLRITTNDTELAVRVARLGIQLTGAVTALPIFVAVDSGEPTQATTVNYTTAGRMQWVDSPIILSGGLSYLVGYYEADLPSGVQAIRRNKAIGAVECASCSPQNSALWTRWKPYLSVDTIRMDAGSYTPDVMTSQNYGLNLSVAVGCDIGPILLRNEFNLAEAIQQQAVVKLLSELAYTAQITTIEQQVRQNAMYALKNGEEAKLETLLNALDINLSGLSERCLPKQEAAGLIRRSTVFNRR